MLNYLKEGISRAFRGNRRALARGAEVSVGPVDEGKLWLDVAKRVVHCMKDGGFYFEIEETPPPFFDVMFGDFYEIALVDKTNVSWEANIYRYHYPGDKGEFQIMQLWHSEPYGSTFVHIRLRSDINMIRLSPDSMVKKHRWISSYPRELDLSEKILLLSTLSEVIVDEGKTQELFNERRQGGRSVAWIRDVPLLSGVLE